MGFLFILLVTVVFLILMVRIVPQSQQYVVERLGKYHATWDAGIHFLVPLIDVVVNKVSLKEQVLDFEPQSVITKDNVTMQIDSIVFMKVFDATKYTYGIANPLNGVASISATTLRNLVGELTLDETLTSRDSINVKMKESVDAATDPWGIEIVRVEVKDIRPPRDIEEVMQKQMTAERDKRQALLEAEAHKQSVIMRAEGDKQAKVLAAEAERDAQIALAEGQAKSIELVYNAEAAGLKQLNETGVDTSILQLKSIEAMKEIADGNATKIFMPTQIMDTIASAGVFGEAMGIAKDQPKKKVEDKKPIPKDPCLHAGVSSTTRKVASTNAQIGRSLEERRDR